MSTAPTPEELAKVDQFLSLAKEFYDRPILNVRVCANLFRRKHDVVFEALAIATGGDVKLVSTKNKDTVNYTPCTSTK